MIDISHIDRELENPSADLDTTDLRLARMLSLISADRFIEAAEVAQSLWLEGYYDLRLVGYYLYGAFAEQGLDSLPEIISCLLQMLRENWDKLGPMQKKLVHGDAAIKWLMSTIVRELKLHENLEDDLWKRWNEGEAAAPLRQALDQFADLEERIINLFSQPKSLPYVQQLEAMISKIERAAESVTSNKRASERRTALVGFARLQDTERNQGGKQSDGGSSSSASSSKSSSSLSSDASSSSAPSSSSSPASDSSQPSSSSSSPALSASSPAPSAASSPSKSSSSKSGVSSTGRDPEDGEDDSDTSSDKETDSEPSSEAREAESASSSPPGDVESDKEREDEESASDAEEDLPLPPPVIPPPVATIPVSHALDVLIRRIAGFERLLRRKDYRRAAIIADDVMKAFENFDPRLYLPTVFSPFFSLLAQHGEKLEGQNPQADNLANRASRYLYQVDLDAFVRGKRS